MRKSIKVGTTYKTNRAGKEGRLVVSCGVNAFREGIGIECEDVVVQIPLDQVDMLISLLTIVKKHRKDFY